MLAASLAEVEAKIQHDRLGDVETKELMDMLAYNQQELQAKTAAEKVDAKETEALVKLD